MVASGMIVGTGLVAVDHIYADGRFGRTSVGGSCANVLLNLAGMGHPVTPVVRLGDDRLADYVESVFAGSGVAIEHVVRDGGIETPEIAELVDTRAGTHGFSFKCPDTGRNYARYAGIELGQVQAAGMLLGACKVFYADRLSPVVLEAMRMAAAGGAHIVFEPSAIDDRDLFSAALGLVTVLKCSEDRISRIDAGILPPGAICVITFGPGGLGVMRGTERRWFDAVRAESVVDTCGAGDMVSAGIIDALSRLEEPLPDISALADGIINGQAMAAANCVVVGARP